MLFSCPCLVADIFEGKLANWKAQAAPGADSGASPMAHRSSLPGGPGPLSGELQCASSWSVSGAWFLRLIARILDCMGNEVTIQPEVEAYRVLK
jgi:hypothetical protein